MVKKLYKFSHIALSTSSKDNRVLPIATQIYEILTHAGIKVSFDESLERLQAKLKVKTKSDKYITNNGELSSLLLVETELCLIAQENMALVEYPF